jgi:hypothetical protein
MAEFIYRSTIYGPQRFTVPDSGGVVEKDGKPLAESGGYLLPSIPSQKPLNATPATLEAVARRWWKQRNAHLDVMGNAARGMLP